MHDTRPSFVASSRLGPHGASTGMQFANFVDPMGAELDHGLSASDGSYSTEWSEGDDERFADNEMASLSTMVAASPSVRSPVEAPESATVHSPVSSTAHSGVSEVSSRFSKTWWHSAFLSTPC